MCSFSSLPFNQIFGAGGQSNVTLCILRSDCYCSLPAAKCIYNKDAKNAIAALLYTNTLWHQSVEIQPSAVPLFFILNIQDTPQMPIHLNSVTEVTVCIYSQNDFIAATPWWFSAIHPDVLHQPTSLCKGLGIAYSSMSSCLISC